MNNPLNASTSNRRPRCARRTLFVLAEAFRNGFSAIMGWLQRLPRKWALAPKGEVLSAPYTHFASTSDNPKGITPQSPGLRACELPWVERTRPSQPQRGCGCPGAPEDATPLGLMAIFRRFPRVARASQPWALRRNPGGIRCSHCDSEMRAMSRVLDRFWSSPIDRKLRRIGAVQKLASMWRFMGREHLQSMVVNRSHER